MNIEFPENELNGFNDQSKTKLAEYIKEFGSDLITEANRLESDRNNSSQIPEITSSMVNDANTLIRRGLLKPKKEMLHYFLRIGSPILSMATSMMYDPNKLVDKTYMFFFIIALTATILTVTFSTIKD